jgi:transcriptional antiterminator NusG|tara:strand:+ start:1353 stop:1895 length:543 start_codon:yes stop_codon:yes gene_type:complete
MNNPEWYILHTYSGQEDKVQQNLKQKAKNQGYSEKIIDVIVPKKDEIEIKDGQKVEVQKNVFPGYILINMVLDDEMWFDVRNTPGVTGFVSSEDENEKRVKPVPLDQAEVNSILNYQDSIPSFTARFNKGDTLRIIDGPFLDFIGSVEDIDEGKSKVTVMVSFFGRDTPVELDFYQVEKE